MPGTASSDLESGDIDSGLVDLSAVDLADLADARYPTNSAFGRSLRRIFTAAEDPDEDMAGRFTNSI